jgi:pimeloyl-ACP methyl ester carboxylesterase
VQLAEHSVDVKELANFRSRVVSGMRADIVDALSGGIGRLEVVEGAGHFTWKDAPDRYWPLVIDFVSTVGRA